MRSRTLARPRDLGPKIQIGAIEWVGATPDGQAGRRSRVIAGVAAAAAAAHVASVVREEGGTLSFLTNRSGIVPQVMARLFFPR